VSTSNSALGTQQSFWKSSDLGPARLLSAEADVRRQRCTTVQIYWSRLRCRSANLVEKRYSYSPLLLQTLHPSSGPKKRWQMPVKTARCSQEACGHKPVIVDSTLKLEQLKRPKRHSTYSTIVGLSQTQAPTSSLRRGFVVPCSTRAWKFPSRSCNSSLHSSASAIPRPHGRDKAKL
jgi:hypothetical protein